MSDLISRSALIDYINSVEFSKRFIQSKDSIQGMLRTFIEEQPTAYDVEKVVEQLEECQANYTQRRANDEYESGLFDGCKHAIDLLKAGGRDDG